MVEIRGVEPLTFSMPLDDDGRERDGAKRREVDFTGFRVCDSLGSFTLKCARVVGLL